jgi:hypothetical protein
VTGAGSGRYRHVKTSLKSFELVLNGYERLLCLPRHAERVLERLNRTGMDARMIERRLTDEQVADPAYPPLLARLRRAEHLHIIGGNPLELLRERLRNAAALLQEHPGALADELLAILKPEEP